MLTPIEALGAVVGLAIGYPLGLVISPFVLRRVRRRVEGR